MKIIRKIKDILYNITEFIGIGIVLGMWIIALAVGVSVIVAPIICFLYFFIQAILTIFGI